MDFYDKNVLAVLGVPLLFTVIAVPLRLGRVPRNGFYGFRTRTTLSSDRIWFAAKAHFGRRLIVASSGSALLILVAYITRPFRPEVLLALSVLCMALPGLAATLTTLRYVLRIKTDQDGMAQKK